MSSKMNTTQDQNKLVGQSKDLIEKEVTTPKVGRRTTDATLADRPWLSKTSQKQSNIIVRENKASMLRKSAKLGQTGPESARNSTGKSFFDHLVKKKKDETSELKAPEIQPKIQTKPTEKLPLKKFVHKTTGQSTRGSHL